MGNTEFRKRRFPNGLYIDFNLASGSVAMGPIAKNYNENLLCNVMGDRYF